MNDGMFEVVSVTDPAIDIDATTVAELEKYARERDVSVLKYKAGQEPTRFLLRRAPHLLWGDYLSYDGTHNDLRRAFCVCVMRVRDLRQEDGSRLETCEITRVGGNEAMNEQTLGRFSPHEVAEIGGVAYRRSFFQSATAVRFLLPPMCHEALAVLISRHAESNRNLAA